MDGEDGSIFVCFVCEKEFRQVTLLEDHMKSHGTMPDMSVDFPSRKRASRGGKTKIPPKIIRKDYEKDSGVNGSIQKFPINLPVAIAKNVIPKSSVKAVNLPALANGSKPENIKPAALSVQNVMKNISQSVKIEPGSKEDLTRRAMRIKKYIQSREENSNKKVQSNDIYEEESAEKTLLEYEGARESIVMVDSTFFSSGTSTKQPLGPTIMNAEPDGFICPLAQKRNAMGNGTQLGRKKNSFMRQKTPPPEAIYSDTVFEMDEEISEATPNYSLTYKHQGRGRGRGKRGRPSKIKEEELYDSEEESNSYNEIRPGRRSQPRRESQDENLKYQCIECFKQFKSFSAMNIHSKSHSEDKEIHCPYCEEVFPQRYILYEHLINDHEESSSLTCPVCKKIFTRPDSLKSHMVRMHEENGGLNCYVCGKNFPSQGQLEMHVRVHTGERPFKCDICEKGFVQKVHLRTHLRTMHNVTDMPTTPCRICEAKFDGRATLREHFTTVHNLSTAEYKLHVAKLRKEGKIPEMIPPKVKVVDPSFRYQNVDVTDMEDEYSEPKSELLDRSFKKKHNGQAVLSKGSAKDITILQKKGSKLKVRPQMEFSKNRAPGMGTVMNLFSDEDMFSPFPFEVEDQPKGRDQEELNIVESAFKVAEEMDQLGETTSTMIVPGEDSSSSGIYYSVPIVLNSSNSMNIISSASTDRKDNGGDTSNIASTLRSINMAEVDDEYAQFAAEHAHIDDTETYEGDSEVAQPSRGSIIKAEPLEIYSDAMEASHPVDMLSM